MARPKKQIESSEEEIQSPTEREFAPETVTMPQYVPYIPPMPRQMQIERQGNTTEPYVKHYPMVRAGICDHCGVLDPKYPSQYQYKMCQHYRGMQLQCSYCPESKNPDEIIYHSILQVMDHPEKGGTLVVVCNSTECQKAHQDRFRRSLS